MNLVDYNMVGLKFDKEGFNKIANDSSLNGTAIIMMLIASIISGIMGYITKQSSIPLGGTNSAVGAMIASFIGTLFMTFILAAVFSFVLKLFGGVTSTGMIIRVMGSVQIWSIIGYLVMSFGLGGIFQLVGFIALLFGVSAFSGKNMFVVFIALILSIILIMIILMGLFIFLFAGLLAMGA